jgi:WhiB family transcriptional regulator, redox-sensing transcriptional regulator
MSTTSALSLAGWREAALCAQVDPELFFPGKGGPLGPARRICAACPVQAACLTDALNTHDVSYGIRAGLTARQRRALLRRTAA